MGIRFTAVQNWYLEGKFTCMDPTKKKKRRIKLTEGTLMKQLLTCLKLKSKFRTNVLFIFQSAPGHLPPSQTVEVSA